MKTWAKHLFFRQIIPGRKGNLGKALLDQRFKTVSFLESKTNFLQKPYLHNVFNKKNYYNLNSSKKVKSWALQLRSLHQGLWPLTKTPLAPSVVNLKVQGLWPLEPLGSLSKVQEGALPEVAHLWCKSKEHYQRSKKFHTYYKVSGLKKFSLSYKNATFANFSYDMNYNVPMLSKSQVLNYKREFFSLKENQPRHNIFTNSKSLFTVGFVAEQSFRSFQKTSKYRRLKPCFAIGGESDGSDNAATGQGPSLSTNLNLSFSTSDNDPSGHEPKGSRSMYQTPLNLRSMTKGSILVKYLNNNIVQEVKVNTKLLYVFIRKILRRYKLQKQSLKYQLAIRNTCKLVLIYVFGSFCWLYLACYGQGPITTKEKFNNRKVGFLFQETVSKNLPLFQKNPSLYTKETVENTVFLNTNVVPPYWDSGPKPMVSSTQLIDQICNSSLSGPLVNIKLSSFFRDFSTQNYIGLSLIKEKNHLVDTNSKNINVVGYGLWPNPKGQGQTTQQKLFFARKPLLITRDWPLAVHHRCNTRGVNLEKQKLLHREQYFFSGTSMVMGPEIDFLPRQLKMTRKTLDSQIKRANTSKINSIGSSINFSPQLAITEQLKWCNNLSPKFLLLGEQSPKKLEEVRQDVGLCTIGARPLRLGTTLDVSTCWTEAPTSKISEEPVGFLFRNLAIKTVPLSRTSGSMDIVIEPRMQSGFNFPDAPIIKKDRENWKNGIAISLKKDLVSNEINYVIPSFAQSSIPKPCKELKTRYFSNKESLQNEPIKLFSKTPFLELVYRKRPLQNSYNQIFASTRCGQRPTNTSFKNNFFPEDLLNSIDTQKPLVQNPGSKFTANERCKELWGEVKTFRNIIGPVAGSHEPLDSQPSVQGASHGTPSKLVSEKIGQNSSVNFVILDKNADIKTFNCLLGGGVFKHEFAKNGAKIQSRGFGPPIRAPLEQDLRAKGHRPVPLEPLGSLLARAPKVQVVGLWPVPHGHVQGHVQEVTKWYGPLHEKCTTFDASPLTYLMPSNSSKIENLLKNKNISEKSSKLLEQKNINSLVFSPESFFGTPYLQLGERFTIEKIKSKNQIGVLYNVHNGDIYAPINSNYPFANMGTSLKTVFGKKWLKQQSSIKTAKTQRVTNARLVSKWEVAHLADTKKHFDNFSINSVLEKNLGKKTNFNQKAFGPTNSLRGLLYLKRISGKANGHIINPFKYYNPGTKRERNIEDTMLTLEGYKKSRLFSKIHTYYQGVNTGSLPFKPGFYDYFRDSDIDVQSILGGMRQSTESKRRAENITGAEELQKNKTDNFLENKTSFDHPLAEGHSTVKKKKKYPFTNCYPFPTLLVNSSQKPFPKNLKPIDKAEYNFSSFSIEQKPINTYNTTALKGLSQTKGFYFEKIFINKPVVARGQYLWCCPEGARTEGPRPKADFYGIIQIWGSLTKILFFIAVWSSYRILAIPLSQSTPFLPAAFTEAIGLNSFQQKYRIITREKIRHFKNVAGNEKTLSELRNLIWLFPLVGTRKHSDFLASFPYIGSQAVAPCTCPWGTGHRPTTCTFGARASSEPKGSRPKVMEHQQRISLRFKERNRFLLYGPPGTGKTLLVRALASEANVPIIVQPVSQLKMIVGVENPVSALFHVARQIKPCIIFLDELDTLGSNLENSTASITPEQKLGIRLARKYTYTLLLELDGLTSSTDDLLVIGATNRPETLNPALMRPGRFETIINCSLPDEKQRLAVLSLYLFYYKQNVSTIKTFQSIQPFALKQKQKVRESKAQVQLANFNTSYSAPLVMPHGQRLRGMGLRTKMQGLKKLTNIYNKTPWDILSENWLLKRKKQPQFFNEQNNKRFYVNYIAQKCYGLSQASIETIVNESALELMQKGVNRAPWPKATGQQHHTLKSLERAIDSVRILTSQETNSSVFSLFKQNKQAVGLVSSTENFLEKTKTEALSSHQVGAISLQNQRSITQGSSIQAEAWDEDSRSEVQTQKVARSWSKIVDTVDSALLEALPKALRVTNGEKNKFIKAHTIKPQLRQFWVNSAYQITGSFIFSQKLNCKTSRKIQDLHINEISQQTTKQGLQLLLKKQYAGQASLSLYTSTRPSITKLSETFGLYKNPANYGTNVLMLQNLIGLDRRFTTRENNFSQFSAFRQEIRHISDNTSKGLVPKGVNASSYSTLKVLAKGRAPEVQGGNEQTQLGGTRPKVQDQRSYTQEHTTLNETLGSKKSYFLPETEFLKLNKTNLLFGSFSSKPKKNLHNNLGFSFQHQISRQIKLNNWLTTGWFRVYLSRPIFRYDNKEYIENKEYYPQNNYTFVFRRPKSSNVSTLAHQPKELSSIFENKNTVCGPRPIPQSFDKQEPLGITPMALASQKLGPSAAPGSIPKVQKGKIFQHSTFIRYKKKQIFSENVSDIQSLYLAIVASAFHQGLLVMQKNRELIDYCVYNILRYGVLYEFSISQICKKF